MITHSMTKDELYKEIASDCMWLDGLREGIAKKYRKRLNPKKVKNGYALLGNATYTTPRNNRVICSWVRAKVGGLLTIECVQYYEYITKSGVRQYISPCFEGNSCTPKTVIIYTGHALSRLKERAGLDLMQMITFSASEEGYQAHFEGQYEYRGKVSKMFNFVDRGMFIIDKIDWGVVAITFVSYDMLGEVQEKEILCCIENAKTYYQQKHERYAEHFNEFSRYQRRKVVL